MRVVVEQSLGATHRMLRFSAAEQATLRKAIAIADEARKLWSESVTYETEGESLDTELAMIAIGATEVIDGIEIDYDPDGGLITQMFGKA